MRARVVLGALAGILLPIPLLLVLAGGWFAQPRVPAAEEARFSPVLSFEERVARVTYHANCSKASDCEPPLGCMGDVRLRTHYCTDSECVTDAQCPEGSVCRARTTRGQGPWVRRCVPVGPRREGERCLNLAPSREEACGPGLLCGGVGWCGRPCRPDAPASCPEGFFCADLPPRPSCLPSCQGRGCPEGQRCIDSQRDGVSVCAVVHGSDCQQASCMDGTKCWHSFAPRRPGEVWMRCVQFCDPRNPVCPRGSACHRRRCEPLCNPQEPGACGTGYRCVQGQPDTPWVCEPDREE